MARKRKNKPTAIKSNTFTVEVRDPGLGYSPALQQASMARTHSDKKITQIGRRQNKVCLKQQTRSGDWD